MTTPRSTLLACAGMLLLAAWIHGAEAEPQTPQIPRASAAQIKQVVASGNRFGGLLYGTLATKQGNLFFSPLSIHAALSQAWAGARGETATELADALALPLQREAFHPAYGALLNELEGAPRAYALKTANAVWLQEDLGVQAEFVTCLKQNYGAALQLADFKKDPETARARINAWVAEKTEKKIDGVLDPGGLDAETRLVLASAIYFKSAWKTPFDRRLTGHRPFTLLDGTEIKVPTMSIEKDSFAFKHCTLETSNAVAQGFDVIELPYEKDALSMLVMVPFGNMDAKRLMFLLEASVAAGGLEKHLDGMKEQPFKVRLPRFAFSCSTDLAEPLRTLGVKRAFSDQEADFSGIAKSAKICLGAVAHKAFVQVDEEGTEAAAATTVKIEEGKDDEPVPVFSADRPFVFLIREKAHGAMLFIGRVMDPRKKE
ncbi:MAG: serpin family protein [Planctomycetota bacterium]|nr:serpin family protein [Planctomycetota bacterium]